MDIHKVEEQKKYNIISQCVLTIIVTNIHMWHRYVYSLSNTNVYI